MTQFTPVQVKIPCCSAINLLSWVHLCALSLALVFCCLPLQAAEFAPPPVMLANVFRSDITLTDYWVSEKFDGMRGYWDGEKLLTRNGEHIDAPVWFTAGWPKVPLDGELWVGRGQFSRTVSTVRKKFPTKPSGTRCTSWYSICRRIQAVFPNEMRHYNLLSRRSDSHGYTMWHSLK
ncbi:hypothetical protein NTGHW29_700012 [Candidatus Nitrotoga sp. HW29]|nr:hypothetical protein NTGHW29_700012 [Candidatus Nitrotoga sp. HW29]